MVSFTSPRRQIVASAVAVVCALASYSIAAPGKASSTVDKALANAYPNAKVVVTDTRDINGVKVHDVTVTDANGVSAAVITDNGDFLLQGTPATVKELPSEVAQTIDGIFGTQPNHVQRFVQYQYFVEMTVNGKKFGVDMDAAGRPININNQKLMRAESLTARPAVNKDVRAKLSALVEKDFKGAQIQSVNETEYPNYYSVTFRQGPEEAWIILSEDGHIRSWAQNMPQIPKEVQTAVAELFKGAKIQKTSLSVDHFYQFDEDRNNDVLTIRIHPDGDIKSITSEDQKRHESAATAVHRVAAGGAKQPS